MSVLLPPLRKRKQGMDVDRAPPPPPKKKRMINPVVDSAASFRRRSGSVFYPSSCAFGSYSYCSYSWVLVASRSTVLRSSALLLLLLLLLLQGWCW